MGKWEKRKAESGKRKVKKEDRRVRNDVFCLSYRDDLLPLTEMEFRTL